MKRKLRLLTFAIFSSLCLTSCSLDLGFISFGDKEENNSETKDGSNPVDGEGEGGGDQGQDGGEGQGDDENPPEPDIIPSGYYAGIDKNSASLLSDLQTLNAKKLNKTVGYGAMGTDPSGQFKYTDYDINTVKYDSKGHRYGTKLISFYSGNSASSGMNREHVWPNSHGGDEVEDDIHMVRPTIKSENGSRGNSFYVEGMKSDKNGWDPAAESFGDETYRGDSARIILYCMVACTKFTLVEEDYHYTTNANPDNMMGRLSHLLKWNLQYDVQDREQRRNEGAEYLQGNRNPFIDHPEFACKIWGTHNQATKQICGGK